MTLLQQIEALEKKTSELKRSREALEASQSPQSEDGSEPEKEEDRSKLPKVLGDESKEKILVDQVKSMPFGKDMPKSMPCGMGAGCGMGGGMVGSTGSMGSGMPGMPSMPGLPSGPGSSGPPLEHRERHPKAGPEHHPHPSVLPPPSPPGKSGLKGDGDDMQEQVMLQMQMQMQMMMMGAMMGSMLGEGDEKKGKKKKKKKGAEDDLPPGPSSDMSHPSYRPLGMENVPGITDRRFEGRITMWFEDKGYGFIGNEELKQRFNGMDVFLQASQKRHFGQGDAVTFNIFKNHRGQPQATELRAA